MQDTSDSSSTSTSTSDSQESGGDRPQATGHFTLNLGSFAPILERYIESALQPSTEPRARCQEASSHAKPGNSRPLTVPAPPNPAPQSGGTGRARSRYLISDFEYFPNSFSQRMSTSGLGKCPRVEIKIPYWCEKEINVERHCYPMGLARYIQRGPSTSNFSMWDAMATRVLLSPEPNEEVEDTSDEAYIAMHERTQAELQEGGREAHEEDGASKFTAVRVDEYAPYPDLSHDLDPDLYMPTRLARFSNKRVEIHVTDEIPVIAFGVKVPRPRSEHFLLPLRPRLSRRKGAKLKKRRL
ncbi:unnamed protein product [Mesocestoides corti]|uniref:Similar to n=1 Tax=Mesocestoides corti TaxID=53468 RepID=A0A0R3UJJ7_MESCO|nr:unnamed protein product [Mesocestoides corti]